MTLCSLPCFNSLFTLDPNPDLNCYCFHLSSVNIIWSSLHLASTRKHNAVFRRALPHLWRGYPSCRATGKGCSSRRATASALAAPTSNARSEPACISGTATALPFQFFLLLLFFKQICKHIRTSGQLLLSCASMNSERSSKVCIFWFEKESPPSISNIDHVYNLQTAQLSLGHVYRASLRTGLRIPQAVFFSASEVTAYFRSLFHHKELTIYASALCVFN